MSKELPQDKVKKHLLKLIKELPPNARLPTEMNLTKELSVGRQTVHKVMSKLRADGLVVRRRRGGSFVAGGKGSFIVESDKGLQVRKNKNGTLLIVYPNWLSEDYWLKVNFAEQESNRLDYEIKHLKLEPTSELKVILDTVKSDASIKAVLFIPPDFNLNKEDLEELDELGLPISIVGAVKKVSSLKNIYMVDQDRGASATLAIKLLMDNGHTKIGYIANEPWGFASVQLKKSMQDCMRVNNMPIRNIVLPQKKNSAWSQSNEVAYNMAKYFFETDITAVVVDSYQGAIAVRRAAYEQNLKIPDDLSVVLLTQPFHNHKYDCPRFSAVFTDRSAILEKAMHVLFEGPETGKKRNITILPEVYIGESVKQL